MGFDKDRSREQRMESLDSSFQDIQNLVSQHLQVTVEQFEALGDEGRAQLRRNYDAFVASTKEKEIELLKMKYHFIEMCKQGGAAEFTARTTGMPIIKKMMKVLNLMYQVITHDEDLLGVDVVDRFKYTPWNEDDEDDRARAQSGIDEFGVRLLREGLEKGQDVTISAVFAMLATIGHIAGNARDGAQWSELIDELRGVKRALEDARDSMMSWVAPLRFRGDTDVADGFERQGPVYNLAIDQIQQWIDYSEAAKQRFEF